MSRLLKTSSTGWRRCAVSRLRMMAAVRDKGRDVLPRPATVQTTRNGFAAAKACRMSADFPIPAGPFTMTTRGRPCSASAAAERNRRRSRSLPTNGSVRRRPVIASIAN